MSVVLRRGVVLLFVVFVCFYMFTDPSGFASFAKAGSAALWSGLEKLFGSVIDFLNALFA